MQDEAAIRAVVWILPDRCRVPMAILSLGLVATDQCIQRPSEVDQQRTPPQLFLATFTFSYVLSPDNLNHVRSLASRTLSRVNNTHKTPLAPPCPVTSCTPSGCGIFR